MDNKTHFIPWDSPGGDRPYVQRRALCGKLSLNRLHANDPECEVCTTKLKEIEKERVE